MSILGKIKDLAGGVAHGVETVLQQPAINASNYQQNQAARAYHSQNSPQALRPTVTDQLGWASPQQQQANQMMQQQRIDQGIPSLFLASPGGPSTAAPADRTLPIYLRKGSNPYLLGPEGF